MKTSSLFVISIVLVTACNTNPTTNTPSVQQIEYPETQDSVQICFQRLEGSSNQDTSNIQLMIRKNIVTGFFDHLPYEKDSRRGTLNGSLNRDTIRAVWTFMQEGMRDSLPIEFLLGDDELLQKSYSVDLKTGRQRLADTAAFSIRYKNINCNHLTYKQAN